MGLRLDVLRGEDLARAIDDVARLRIAVFRDWPYLYDGDLSYERSYLQSYLESERSVVVGAFDGDDLVGASTGAPLADHAEDFAAAFKGAGLALEDVFYCADRFCCPSTVGRGLDIGSSICARPTRRSWILQCPHSVASSALTIIRPNRRITAICMISGASAGISPCRAWWLVFPGATLGIRKKPASLCSFGRGT